MLGLCNNEKEALSQCLHEARLAGERELIKQRRQERKMVEEKWKKIDEEEYGEDAILKKIIERHQAKLNGSKTDGKSE